MGERDVTKTVIIDDPDAGLGQCMMLVFHSLFHRAFYAAALSVEAFVAPVGVSRQPVAQYRAIIAVQNGGALEAKSSSDEAGAGKARASIIGTTGLDWTLSCSAGQCCNPQPTTHNPVP